MRNTIYFIFLLGWAMCTSCSSDNDAKPESSFVKVYDHADASISFYPIDAIELGDGSIIILSAISDTENTNYPKIHLLKTDAKGTVEWENNAPASYVNPVPGLMKVNDQVRLICMDDNSFRTKILSINTANGEVNELATDNSNYPLAAYYDNQTETTLVLSYDAIGTSSVITGLNQSFSETFRTNTLTNKDFSYEIFQHLKKQRIPFPFFISSFKENNSHYMINGFSNYTLSLLMVDQNSGAITGRINGFQEQGGISTATPLGTNELALATSKFNSGDIGIGPRNTIDVGTTQNVTQLNTINFSELKVEAPVKVISEIFNNQETIVYSATTKTNQVALYFFDAESQEIIYTKYLGHTNPLEISSLLKTKDDGLIVMGKTWVSGRFQRIIMYKLSKDEFLD